MIEAKRGTEHPPSKPDFWPLCCPANQILQRGMPMFPTIAATADDSQSRDEVFAGFGSGLPCTICNEPIKPSQVEYEVRSITKTLPMHLECFTAWSRTEPNP